MTAIAKREIDDTPDECLESALIPFDLDGLDELYCDIAEIINENFILEVEASKELVGKKRVRQE
jgi:hypothetical protein